MVIGKTALCVMVKRGSHLSICGCGFGQRAGVLLDTHFPQHPSSGPDNDVCLVLGGHVQVIYWTWNAESVKRGKGYPPVRPAVIHRGNSMTERLLP